jgi:hypothetical protein
MSSDPQKHCKQMLALSGSSSREINASINNRTTDRWDCIYNSDWFHFELYLTNNIYRVDDFVKKYQLTLDSGNNIVKKSIFYGLFEKNIPESTFRKLLHKLPKIEQEVLKNQYLALANGKSTIYPKTHPLVLAVSKKWDLFKKHLFDGTFNKPSKFSDTLKDSLDMEPKYGEFFHRDHPYNHSVFTVLYNYKKDCFRKIKEYIPSLQIITIITDKTKLKERFIKNEEYQRLKINTNINNYIAAQNVPLQKIMISLLSTDVSTNDYGLTPELLAILKIDNMTWDEKRKKLKQKLDDDAEKKIEALNSLLLDYDKIFSLINKSIKHATSLPMSWFAYVGSIDTEDRPDYDNYDNDDDYYWIDFTPTLSGHHLLALDTTTNEFETSIDNLLQKIDIQINHQYTFIRDLDDNYNARVTIRFDNKDERDAVYKELNLFAYSLNEGNTRTFTDMNQTERENFTITFFKKVKKEEKPIGTDMPFELSQLTAKHISY